MNGNSPTTKEPDKWTFIERVLALPWRKFALACALLFAGYIVSFLVSCSTVRVIGNAGDSRVRVNQSVDSSQIVVEFKNIPK